MEEEVGVESGVGVRVGVGIGSGMESVSSLPEPDGLLMTVRVDSEGVVVSRQQEGSGYGYCLSAGAHRVKVVFTTPNTDDASGNGGGNGGSSVGSGGWGTGGGTGGGRGTMIANGNYVSGGGSGSGMIDGALWSLTTTALLTVTRLPTTIVWPATPDLRYTHTHTHTHSLSLSLSLFLTTLSIHLDNPLSEDILSTHAINPPSHHLLTIPFLHRTIEASRPLTPAHLNAYLVTPPLNTPTTAITTNNNDNTSTAHGRGLVDLVNGSNATPLIYTTLPSRNATNTRASPRPSPGLLAETSPGLLAEPSPGLLAETSPDSLAVVPGTRFPPHSDEIILRATFDPAQVIGSQPEDNRPPLLSGANT